MIGLLILIWVVEKISNKLLRVEKKKFSETSGKSVDRWAKAIILIIILITLWYGTGNESDTLRTFYCMICLALIFGFQAIMEFIFLEGSRQYITTTILLTIVLVILYNINHFPFWIRQD